MSTPPTWEECRQWLKGEGKEEQCLKDDLQGCVDSRRPINDLLPLLEEYLLFLRVKETISIMQNPAQRTEKTYTDALHRLQTDIEKLIKGTLNHA